MGLGLGSSRGGSGETDVGSVSGTEDEEENTCAEEGVDNVLRSRIGGYCGQL